MFLRKRLAISDHFEGLWSVGTRFRQLRQSQALNKKLAMSPSSTMFMAASMILNMCHSSSYCMRHSWRTYSRGDKLEPARSSVEHMARLQYGALSFPKVTRALLRVRILVWTSASSCLAMNLHTSNRKIRYSQKITIQIIQPPACRYVMLCRICVVPTQSRKPVLYYADYTVPTREHERQTMQIRTTSALQGLHHKFGNRWSGRGAEPVY